MRLPIKDKKVSKFKFARHLVILPPAPPEPLVGGRQQQFGGPAPAPLSPVVVQVSANLRAQVGTSVCECVCVLLLSPGIDYANSALSAEVLLATREQNTVNFATSKKSSPFLL